MPLARGGTRAARTALARELVVLDLSGGRELESGWRADLDCRAVDIDRADGCALEADLFVLPCATIPPD